MKYFIITILLMTSSVSKAALTLNDHYYLQIVLNDGTNVSYPPGTGFLLENKNGNNILNPSKLIELRSYKINNENTLYVFPTYKTTPDVYDITEGTLYMKLAEYIDKKTTNQNRVKDKVKNISSNNVSLLKKRFFDYSDENGYDTSIEFSNDVIFYFRDGKAEAWQQGETLKIEGKYIIYSKLGIIKLSYNPFNKEIWYVFEKY
ncbi:hypothetical protein [Aquimarina sp. SS2-1]|uniref:hypothetical protein n=1 Tax=Aquimarina besae TaxID=3342247 RepID=UPI003670F5E6